MALKTGEWILALLLATARLAGQGSPIQWPLPPPGPPRAAVFPRVLIGARELAGALEKGAIPLDVRGNGLYAAGHLPGAVPAWSPGEEAPELDRVRSLLAGRGIGGGETVVIYGDPDREESGRLYWLLRWAGCAEVRVLDGGMAAWRAAGGALESGPARRAPAAAFRAASREATADASWIADGFARPGVELLDVRDARGWERWQTPPTFAAGHIPYSLPLDPRGLLPTGGGWPDPAAVRRRLAAFGPRPGDPVRLDSLFVLYGEDGRDPRPGLGYLLLTLAGLDARVDPGGWKEWRAGGRPVVQVVSAAELATRLRREDPELADRPPRDLILLDLREPRDFRIGHLPGARSLPFSGLPAELERMVAAGWPGADRARIPLALYCYGIDCVRSRKAGAQAARLGFHDVLWFRGGVDEWRDAGYPLFESPATPPAASPPLPPEPASPARGDGRP